MTNGSTYGQAWEVAERGTMYIKIDDDLMFIEESAVASLIATKVAHPARRFAPWRSLPMHGIQRLTFHRRRSTSLSPRTPSTHHGWHGCTPISAPSIPTYPKSPHHQRPMPARTTLTGVHPFSPCGTVTPPLSPSRLTLITPQTATSAGFPSRHPSAPLLKAHQLAYFNTNPAPKVSATGQ